MEDRLSAYIDIQITDLLPESPVGFHLSKINILNTVDVQGDHSHCFVAFCLLDAKIERFDLTGRLQFVN